MWNEKSYRSTSAHKWLGVKISGQTSAAASALWHLISTPWAEVEAPRPLQKDVSLHLSAPKNYRHLGGLFILELQLSWKAVDTWQSPLYSDVVAGTNPGKGLLMRSQTGVHINLIIFSQQIAQVLLSKFPQVHEVSKMKHCGGWTCYVGVLGKKHIALVA